MRFPIRVFSLFVFTAVLGLGVSGLSPSPAPSPARADEAMDAVFSQVEKRLIKEFFGNQDKGSPEAKGKKGRGKNAAGGAAGGKGRKGKQGLPPGLAKRETLPPGLAGRDLPPGLQSGLPDAAQGTERKIVDNDMVLIEKATGKVLDILADVIKN